MSENDGAIAEKLARLVELEEEQAEREKEKQKSAQWGAFSSLMFMLAAALFLWANWATIKAWLILNGFI